MLNSTRRAFCAFNPARWRSVGESTRRSAAASQGAANLFFLGTGGAAILMQPAAQLLQRRSAFPTYARSPPSWWPAGTRHWAALDRGEFPRLSGTTAESVAASSSPRPKVLRSSC